MIFDAGVARVEAKATAAGLRASDLLKLYICGHLACLRVKRIHVSPGVGFLGRRGVSRGWTGAVEPRAFAATLASARYWPSVMVRRLLPSVSEIIQVQGRPMAGLLIYLILRDYRNPDAS
jgi:hypothetical protein